MGTQGHKIDPSVLKQLGLPQKLIQKTTLVNSTGTSEIEFENNSSSKKFKSADGRKNWWFSRHASEKYNHVPFNKLSQEIS